MSSNPPLLDRLPPHSVEAEKGVLACILLESRTCLPEARVAVAAESFYDLRHRTIWNACCALDDERKPVDMLTLHEALKATHQIEAVGGLEYLAPLPDCVPSAANLKYYLEIVAQKATLRRLIQHCTETISRAYDAQDSPSALLDWYESQALQIRRSGASEMRTARDLVAEGIAGLEVEFETKGAVDGVPTGFPDLDRLIGGLKRGELIVIAAPPACGKTSLGLNLVENASVLAKLPSGVFSVEMSGVELMKRSLCSLARVNMDNVRNGFMAERDFPKLTGAAGRLAAAPIWYHDPSELSIDEFRARARRLHQEHAVKLIVVDYLQLLYASNGKGEENREREVNRIARGLKSTAKELGLPVVTMSQLTDDGLLRESRAIGQHADQVWKIEPEGEEDEHADARPVILNVKKNRNGKTGIVRLTFLRCFTRFESAAKISDADRPNYDHD